MSGGQMPRVTATGRFAGRARTSGTTPFCRDKLPTPTRYLTDRGFLVRQPQGEWVTIVCPRHKGGNEKRPSMGVSLADGHFRCHACGAKGGDIIALHRLITGMGFRDALRDLGALGDRQ
jgi:CHC2 zinc finger